MSLLSKLTGVHIKVGGTIGKIANSVGNGLEKYGIPIAATALLGPAGGALATGAERMATGHSLGQSALDAASAYGGGSLLKGLGNIPGVSSVGSALSHIPGVSGAEGAIQGIGQKLGQVPGVQGIESSLSGAGGLLGKAGSFLTGNGGMNALGAAEGVNAALLQKQASEYAKNALGTAQQSYNERAPLRTAGIQGMLNPGAGIGAQIQALPQGANPYAQKPTIQPVGRAS